MGLPRRRSRLVHIDGVAYRWLATPHWSFEVNEDGERWRRTLLFADLYVERRVRPACQLRLRLYADWLLSWGRDPYDRLCIDPPMVRRAVLLALVRGWDPDAAGPHYFFPVEDVRHIRTPRHLLYAAPIIARVTVRDVTETAPGHSAAVVRVVERLQGSLESESRLVLSQPASQLPRDALAFLSPSSQDAGTFTGWSWYGGLFRISRGAALLYDNSGEEHRWRYCPLRDVRAELSRVRQLLPVPAGLADVPIEE